MTRVHFRQRATLVLAAASLAVAIAAPTFGQGMLIDVRPGHHFRLPRPIWPPRPEPQPSSYKIESLEVNAKLADTTARVQVSQTFKNTGSEPFVSLRYFGPDTHKDLPKVGDHARSRP